jgi:glycosyltransferase involved in cell wall biosynthesis
MRADLERRTAAGGLAHRVHFTGFLDAGERADALAASSLVVIPSRREAMSNVVLEAAAAARPVLATDTCGLAEVERSGGGWVVGATVAGLEAGLRQAMSEGERLAPRGAAWRTYAADRFSWSRVAALYLELFSRVVHAAPRVPR